VGKTLEFRDRFLKLAVHPHACGEDLLVGWNSIVVLRFTPTRVGKTFVDVEEYWDDTVHPHACGEDGAQVAISTEAFGSPPRVWGRRWSCPTFIWGGRFTPTRVGKTSSGTPLFRSASVHPHACGEDAGSTHPIARSRGSPPRVWGRP